MFADPQSITIAGVAHSLPRIESNGQRAVYEKADQSVRLIISHTVVKNKTGSERIKTLVQVIQRKVVVDPLTAANDYDTISYHIVLERPSYGFSSTEISDLIVGFEAWQDATAIGKLYGRES